MGREEWLAKVEVTRLTRTIRERLWPRTSAMQRNQEHGGLLPRAPLSSGLPCPDELLRLPGEDSNYARDAQRHPCPELKVLPVSWLLPVICPSSHFSPFPFSPYTIVAVSDGYRATEIPITKRVTAAYA